MITKSATTYHSPVGYLQIVEEQNFITEITFLDSEEPGGSEEKSETQKKCIAELEEYFNGERKSFTIPVNPAGTDFEKEVWNELSKIPIGTTISYEELAIRLGDLKKIRAAGRANGKNPLAIVVPCHRVIGKNGSLVGYAGGLHRKEWLLIHEGVINEQTSIF